MDESRILRGPGSIFVFVPYPASRRPEDVTKDFPPGDPPTVHYLGRVSNYFEVLQDGSVPLGRGTAKLTKDRLDWLQSTIQKREGRAELMKARPAESVAAEYNTQSGLGKWQNQKSRFRSTNSNKSWLIANFAFSMWGWR